MALLIASSLVAGVHGTSIQQPGERTTAYRCCCAGECHCTGDCCNHGPKNIRPGRSPQLRDGSGSPIWRGADRCGAWLVTLHRAPGPVKALPAGELRHARVQPDGCRFESFPLRAVVSQEPNASPSSPRAPPAA